MQRLHANMIVNMKDKNKRKICISGVLIYLFSFKTIKTFQQHVTNKYIST